MSMIRRTAMRPSSLVRFASVAFILACLIAALWGLSGCSEQGEENTERAHVTVSVWDESVISSGFADYIDSLNPTYDIEWLVGEDSLEFYQYQAEEGSLPDVILVHDFNRSTATTLSSSLYDLSETDFASTYQSSYLDQIPGNNESLVYIPGDSGFEGILVNEYLFDLYDIAIPTDRASFIEACQAFAQNGIRGFVAGMGDPETCFEVMQGFADEALVSEAENLIDQLLKRDPTITVDSSALDNSLEYINSLIDAKVIQQDDMSLSLEDAEASFVAGEAAMYFLPSGDASSFGAQHNMTVRAIPFFGSSSTWAVAAPTFIGMVSNVQSEGVSTASSEEMARGAREVLASIMSSDAQAYYRELYNIDTFVSPQTSTTSATLSNTLAPLEGCVQEGNVRLSLSNQETNQALGTMLTELVSGSIASDEAVTESIKLLQNEQVKDSTNVTSFSEGVSCLFDEDLGNVAASDIAQVAAAQASCDFFISSARTARCPLYDGDKTATELKYPVAPTAVYTATLTGSDLEQLISSAVSQARSNYDLPVLSNLHIEVSKTEDGYQLDSIERIITEQTDKSTTNSSNSTAANEGRVETEPLDAESTYTVGLSCYEQELLSPAIETYSFTKLDQSLQTLWVQAFEDKTIAGLPAYQDYFAFTQP